MKLYVAGILGLSVSACVPGIPIPMPVSGGPPKVEPASEVMDVAAITPRDGAGVIVVSRDRRLLAKECIFDISVDGQVVAGLRTGEQVTLYADPGDRILGVNTGRVGTCDPADAQVAVQVVANTTKKVRVRSNGYYDIIIESSSY
jgi:hypothetical protein